MRRPCLALYHCLKRRDGQCDSVPGTLISTAEAQRARRPSGLSAGLEVQSIPGNPIDITITRITIGAIIHVVTAATMQANRVAILRLRPLRWNPIKAHPPRTPPGRRNIAVNSDVTTIFVQPRRWPIDSWVTAKAIAIPSSTTMAIDKRRLVTGIRPKGIKSAQSKAEYPNNSGATLRISMPMNVPVMNSPVGITRLPRHRVAAPHTAVPRNLPRAGRRRSAEVEVT